MSLDWHLSIDVDTGGEVVHNLSLGEWNLTYNLTQMINIAYGAQRYYDEWDGKTGGDIIEGLEGAINRMEADPKRYKTYNPPNGWGTYDGALEVLKDFLEACKNHPKARVSMWR